MNEVKNFKNYKIIEIAEIEELNSVAYHLVHEKTNAEILYLKNDDEIKAFGVGFKTPPEDSTGVAHIVEHCVLSGSRKYRTKEPFMDLVNSSMQTFLNAMTFPDKTIYPVASRNLKDFYNLMDVYLDAVFYPRIYEVKEIFEQEGWHMELENPDGEIKYNGVVYNEMRGAYSDPEGQAQEYLAATLHPNSTYDHDSGGNPYEIINLTYENFLDFHRSYYHPSNSYIYFYGDLDIDEALDYLDKDYLSNFEYEEPKSKIVMNEPIVEPETVVKEYSIGEDEETNNRAYLSYGVSMGESKSTLDNFMQTLLADVVLNSDSSILMDKLLESGIAEDYYATGSSGIAQDLFIVAKNANENDLDKFTEIIESELKKAIEEGIDKDTISATLTKIEFGLKELGIHRGVRLYIMALSGWLYGASPIGSLKYLSSIEYVKENLNTDFVEKYIEEKILNNPYKVKLLVKPVKGLFKKNDEELNSNLEALKKTMSQDEIERLIGETANLFNYQLSEDSKEDKATIPKLSVLDISPGVRELKINNEEIDDITFIHVDEFTDGISYVELAFELNTLTEEELPYGGLVLDLLTSLDTDNYNYKNLNNQIYINSGGINITSSTPENFITGEYTPLTSVGTKALPENLEKALSLVEEVVLRTKFDDVKRIKDMLTMEKSSIEGDMESGGHQLVITEIQSMLKESSNVRNIIDGRKYFLFLKDILNNFDENSEKIIAKLSDVYVKLFNTALTVSVAGEKDWYEDVKAWALNLKNNLYPKANNLSISKYTGHSLALQNSSNVVYVGTGFTYKNLGYEYSGRMSILSQLLSGDYLHTNIRAKGGAYGSGIVINNSGIVATYSYRDPNLDNTMRVYREIPEFIEGLNMKDEDLLSYKIATMNQFDPPLIPTQYAPIAMMRHFTKIKNSDIVKMKEEALETTVNDLKDMIPMFKEGQKNQVSVVFGSSDIINRSETKYEETIIVNK